MEAFSRDLSTEDNAVALRGRMVSITALEVYTPDLQEIELQLREKASQAPAFFNGAPLLLDLANLKEEVDLTWLGKAYALIVDNDFVAIGVTGAKSSLEEEARRGGIPVWPSAGTKRNSKERSDAEPKQQPAEPNASPEVSQKPSAEPPNQPTEQQSTEPQSSDQEGIDQESAEPSSAPPHSPTRVLYTPVRSGQRFYARGGDLIVLASVNTGAEIMADGHIHVYGSLRGRALAGVKGQEDARIFCHDLQADLVAIAGYYLINEDLPAEKRGKAVQISLKNETLNIDPL